MKKSTLFILIGSGVAVLGVLFIGVILVLLLAMGPSATNETVASEEPIIETITTEEVATTEAVQIEQVTTEEIVEEPTTETVDYSEFEGEGDPPTEEEELIIDVTNYEDVLRDGLELGTKVYIYDAEIIDTDVSSILVSIKYTDEQNNIKRYSFIVNGCNVRVTSGQTVAVHASYIGYNPTHGCLVLHASDIIVY